MSELIQRKANPTVKRNVRRIAVRAGVAVATASVSLMGMSVAWANGSNAGPATITQPNGSTPLNNGGSATPWTIKLPTLASCSKDTTNGQYHVESYIVPTGVDPSTLLFSSTGPVDPNGNATVFPLYDTNGNPYVATNTAIGTGQVPQSPTFNYALFSTTGSGGNANTLPPGTYNVGIACSTNVPGTVAGTKTEDKFWNVQETFLASNTDPNGEVWSVVPNQQVPESPLTIALPISAVVLMGAGVVVVRRRRRSADTPAAA